MKVWGWSWEGAIPTLMCCTECINWKRTKSLLSGLIFNSVYSISIKKIKYVELHLISRGKAENNMKLQFYYIYYVLRRNGLHLRQLASSLPSLQSGSPSHLHFLWIHSPERHCISLVEHLAGGVGWRPQREGDSSDWSCAGQKNDQVSLQGVLFVMRKWVLLGIKWSLCFNQHSAQAF